VPAEELHGLFEKEMRVVLDGATDAGRFDDEVERYVILQLTNMVLLFDLIEQRDDIEERR
jgi:hypothetical protein